MTHLFSVDKVVNYFAQLGDEAEEYVRILKNGRVKNFQDFEAPNKPELVAKKALEAGISQVAFDRSGFKYHGRVKALADAAREAGLKF